MLRSIWQCTWIPRTEMFTSKSVTNTLYMISTFYPTPSMTRIWARLSSTHLPRKWTLYTQTGTRRLLDVENNMIGRHQGAIMQIQRLANTVFMRVWFSTHHINLGMHLFYLATPGTFYSNFTSLVSYLRRQKKLISDKRGHCPLIYNNR